MMIMRDTLGRQVLTIDETADELGMTITAGKTYRFRGRRFLADLTDQTTDTLASFQSLDTGSGPEPLPDPSMWLERDGSLTDLTGAPLGDYHELEWGAAEENMNIIDADDEEWGPDSAQQALERGPA